MYDCGVPADLFFNIDKIFVRSTWHVLVDHLIRVTLRRRAEDTLDARGGHVSLVSFADNKVCRTLLVRMGTGGDV